MKVVLAGYGTRGDVEPFATVGRELLRRGHDVCMAVPPNMVGFLASAELDAVPFGPESLASSRKRMAQAPGSGVVEREGVPVPGPGGVGHDADGAGKRGRPAGYGQNRAGAGRQRRGTHTLVGVGAALFMLISKYGFNDVLEPGRIVLDPSRIGAQIVTGVGFLGAGLIFVKRDSVRGLTTAAAIWVTAAVGAASGAGLPVLAVMTTAIYFLIALVFPLVTRRLPQSSTAVSMIRVRYPDGRGLLRQLLEIATQRGFAIDEVSTEMVDHPRSASGDDSAHSRAVAEVTLHVHGKSSINELAAAFSEVDEVEAVLADDINAVDE